MRIILDPDQVTMIASAAAKLGSVTNVISARLLVPLSAYPALAAQTEREVIKVRLDLEVVPDPDLIGSGGLLETV